MVRNKPIRFVQLNAGRARSVTDELVAVMGKVRPTIVLLQEPYSMQGRILGFPLTCKIVLDIGEIPRTAVVIPDRTVEVVRLTNLTTEFCTCVHVTSPEVDVYVVSVYFPHEGDITPHVDHLERIVRTLQGKPIVMGGDFNTESAMWGRAQLNARDPRRIAILEDFLAAGNLQLGNNNQGVPTFCTVLGESFIDVTLVTNNIHCRKWCVNETWVSSDHRAISFEVGLNQQQREKRQRHEGLPRFALRRADWSQYLENLLVLWPKIEENFGELNEATISKAVNSLQGGLLRATEGSVPRTRTTTTVREPIWWTAELTEKKKNLQILRRRAQRETDPLIKVTRRREYSREMVTYKRAIVGARSRSWRGFLTNEGTKSPWGLGYRIHGERLKTGIVLDSLRTTQGDTLSVE